VDQGPVPPPPRKLDRYAIFDEIASGGMATVHLGRLLGPVGFTRTVAIKRMHAHLATEPDFVTMFLDEARLAARIRHPNVVSILDVVSVPGELALVMEFIQGEALDRLLRELRNRGERAPPHIANSIAAGMLHGLHAAHEATNERGEPLEIVHRDVSPQNVLVGIDGVVRVVDFGIAKAQGRLGTTREGQLKGKLMYMSPEQALHEDVDRRTDVFAAGIVLWEMLVGKRLFEGIHEAAILSKVLGKEVEPPSAFDPSLVRFDRVVMRALSRDPAARYPSARAMVVELERVWALATPTDLGAWVERLAGDAIQRRTERMVAIERIPVEELPSGSLPPPAPGSIPPAAPPTARTVIEGRRSEPPARPRETSRVGSSGDVSAISAPTTGASSDSGAAWQEASFDGSYRDEGARVRSQVSTISVSRSQPVVVSRMSSRTRIWIATVGASMFAGALLAVALFAGSRSTSPPSPTHVQESAAPAAVPAASPPASSATAATPAPPATVVDEEALEPRAAPSASAAPIAGKPRPTRPPATTAPRATAASSAQKPTDYGF
jgi:serine/threonine-protein kinase